MEKYIQNLQSRHELHIECYGQENEKRLIGTHETEVIGTFTWGVADRGASVRIPRMCHQAGCGYIEDRRPASN